MRAKKGKSIEERLVELTKNAVIISVSNKIHYVTIFLFRQIFETLLETSGNKNVFSKLVAITGER
jgi:hypothetical protein